MHFVANSALVVPFIAWSEGPATFCAVVGETLKSNLPGCICFSSLLQKKDKKELT